jgi:preprotein translocase subunit YajC
MQRLSVAFIVLVSAVATFAQTTPQAKKGGFGDPSFLFMMVAIFVIMYFFILRPQSKKQKETQTMLKNLKKGDKVLTIAGIVGIVGNVKETSVMVKVADSTVLEFKKAAISAVLNDSAEETETSKS